MPESTTPLTQEEEERLRAVLGFQRPVNPSWEDIDNRCVGQCEHANHGPFFCDVIVGGTFEPEYCECPPDRTMWSLILDYSARLFATLDAARAAAPDGLREALRAWLTEPDPGRGRRVALTPAETALVDAAEAWFAALNPEEPRHAE